MLELFTTDWRDLWSGAESHEPVGAIFTKPEIVELILDLAGYVPSRKRLAIQPLLEPSCGDGAFLSVVVNRLVASEQQRAGGIKWHDSALDNSIRAADISRSSIVAARKLVAAQLMDAGCPADRALALAEQWVVQTDFLLTDWPFRFEFVIGNPPYVRIEDLPKRVLGRYRELFATTTDRADLYVAFFEKGLELLSPSGVLAFICANRFTKNKYGEALRRLIAQKYHVRQYLNLEHTQPFLSDVSAYPAIFIIDKCRGEPTQAGTLNDIEPATLQAVRSASLGQQREQRTMVEFPSWYPKGEPWLTTCDEEHDLLARLNHALPRLEESAPATKVGIGIATGADGVFILKAKDPTIEESRQIPLLMPADVRNDELRWSGRYLLNPFADADDGSLVDLAAYPGFAAHIERHAEQLLHRHVAKTRPSTWYRTIDRVWPQLQRRSKLMIPDIQAATTIGFDEGRYYPHHNLYWITSDEWPLLALKCILRSEIVFKQVRAYSVQMRGGSVRFQAQTLRRVRVPLLKSLTNGMIDELVRMASSADQHAIDELVSEAYRVSGLR